jgi:hypothetical protein
MVWIIPITVCVRDHDGFRRGSKKLVPEKKEDELESHFGTSMLFTKSMKAL